MTSFVKKSDGQVLTAEDYNGNLEHGYWSGAIYDADVGGDDTYVATIDPVPTSYNLGMTIRLKVSTGNTGAASLNVNSLGAVTIKKNVADDLETGDILANQIITVKYDGTNFQLVEVSNQVKISGNDTALGYLEDKVVGVTDKIVVTTLNDGGNEDLQIDIGDDVFDKDVDDTDDITEGATNKFLLAASVDSAKLDLANLDISIGTSNVDTDITGKEYIFPGFTVNSANFGGTDSQIQFIVKSSAPSTVTSVLRIISGLTSGGISVRFKYFN